VSELSGFDPTGQVPMAQHAAARRARVDASLQAPKIMICGSPTSSLPWWRASATHTHTRFLSVADQHP